MVARCCISILVCCALGIPFALEQPASSILELHPAMQFIAKKFAIYKAWLVDRERTWGPLGAVMSSERESIPVGRRCGFGLGAMAIPVPWSHTFQVLTTYYL